jgi:hypothetical protein
MFIWMYSGGGGVESMKDLKGGVSYKSLGISVLDPLSHYTYSMFGNCANIQLENY